MPLKYVPRVRSLVLTSLRRGKGLHAHELAALLSVPESVINRYEGEMEPPYELLVGWCARMGYTNEEVDWAVFGLTQATREAPAEGSPVAPTPIELRRIREVAGRYCRALYVRCEEILIRAARAFKNSLARKEAAERWQELERTPPEFRRAVIEKAPGFQTWSVSERLAHESEKAASDRADRALDLALLGYRAAELCGGDEATLAGVKGYALVHVANARRVANQMHQAGEDFDRALVDWDKASPEIKQVLAAWRVKDQEGSLRRDQRRFPEALERLQEAREMAPPAAIPRILVKWAVTLEHMWEPEAAVKLLREAEALSGPQQEPELLLKIYYNLAANLGHLRKFHEMAQYLPLVLDRAIAGRKELDLVRVGWLRARCAAGFGHIQEARQGYNQARRVFKSHGMAYDYALACLELAVLNFEDGQHKEVQALAVEMEWIFKAEGIHREALAAISIFLESTAQVTASADMATRVVRYLYRAQHDPALRFEEVEPSRCATTSLTPGGPH